MIKLPHASYACQRSDTSILTSSGAAFVSLGLMSPPYSDRHLSKRGRSVSGEYGLAGSLGHTVGKREF